MFHRLPNDVKLSIFSFLADKKDIRNILISDKANYSLKERHLLQALREQFGVREIPEKQSVQDYYLQLIKERDHTIEFLTAYSLLEKVSALQNQNYQFKVTNSIDESITYRSDVSAQTIQKILGAYPAFEKEKIELHASYTAKMKELCRQPAVSHHLILIKGLCETNSLALLTLMLKRYPAIFDNINHEQQLMYAALNYMNKESVELLAPKLKDINAKVAGQTYLSWICYLTCAIYKWEQGRDIVKLLINHGARPATNEGDNLTFEHCNSRGTRGAYGINATPPEFFEFLKFVLAYRKEEQQEENTMRRRL